MDATFEAVILYVAPFGTIALSTVITSPLNTNWVFAITILFICKKVVRFIALLFKTEIARKIGFPVLFVYVVPATLLAVTSCHVWPTPISFKSAVFALGATAELTSASVATLTPFYRYIIRCSTY